MSRSDPFAPGTKYRVGPKEIHGVYPVHWYAGYICEIRYECKGLSQPCYRVRMIDGPAIGREWFVFVSELKPLDFEKVNLYSKRGNDGISLSL